jgi:CubicO group peptidase (beta-lactamase class C family)
VERATGMAVDAYAQDKLWGPLGIEAEWDTDGSGNVETYQNVRASCRDHAKFGYLYLRRGCWDGERIVQEDWVDVATSTSQDLNRGYGYLFWIMGQEPTLTSVNFDEVEGGLQPFAPDGTYAARGLGGQLIEVVPEYDMVIVRGGVAPMDDPELITDPLALIDALVNGDDDDVTGNIAELILDGVEP